MEENLKKYIIWFETNYEYILNISKVYITDLEIVNDIINDIYLYLKVQQKFIPKSIIEEHKEINYFYHMLKNKYYNYRKNESKRKSLEKNIVLDYFNRLEDEKKTNENTLLYDDIFEKLNKLYNEKKITWYSYKLFKIFFDPETENDITDLSKKEVNKLRKAGYRKFENSLKIDHSTLHQNIKKTIALLKK